MKNMLKRLLCRHEWVLMALVRNVHTEFRCSKCGATTKQLWRVKLGKVRKNPSVQVDRRKPWRAE